MSYRKTLPEHGYLHDLFIYNKTTGSLTWKVRPINHFSSLHVCNNWNSKNSGNLIKIKKQKGLCVIIDKKCYLAHRVIYKMVNNKEPPEFLDHKNGNQYDNSWDNIREATSFDNARNCKRRCDNKSGLKGVRFYRGKYCAQIGYENKIKYLGSFDTQEDAKQAYIKASIELFGDFYREIN